MIKRGIDFVIGECDELDNLLMFYSVELLVSFFVVLERVGWLVGC